MIVIIPSNRTINLNYLEPLIEAGAHFLVVDDSDGNIKVNHPQFEVFNWNDRKRMLGKLDRGFPRRNGACRDFGFYLAWQRSEPDEIIVALDDDCCVDAPNFHDEVEEALLPQRLPVAQAAGVHFNVLNLYKDQEAAHLFPRGFPYSARDQYQSWTIGSEEECCVDFHLGLWREVFDINAIDKIKLAKWSFPEAELHHNQVVVPKGALISACSMNMQFRAKLVPAVYQLPMHVGVLPGWVIDRYGDIWGGFILKTLMDIKGDQMSVGGPMIRHLKDGDFLRNIWQEHLCHLVNDEFITLLRECSKEILDASYIDMMGQLREELARRADLCSSILGAYIRHLDDSMDCWLKALRRVEPKH